MRTTLRRLTLLLPLALAIGGAQGCALKHLAMNSVANSLAKSGDSFGGDDDPALIRDAAPFSLKLLESLLEELPRHRGLLLAACSGFTQYSYAFVESDAELIKDSDYRGFVRLQDRARNMYLRGRDYCLRSLELGYPGIRTRLAADPPGALRRMGQADVPLLYWTAASWGRTIAISLDRPALIDDLPAVQALIRRALQIDEAFKQGALHEVMIALESAPEAMGGSPERAREHFERALTLSSHASAGPYVTFARSVLLPQQKRVEFTEMLNRALEIDVDANRPLRLANILAQQQARFLLEHLADLFLDGPEDAAARAKREVIWW
jgi:predicted anti-sigma-YlaC factor YlaD